MIALLLTIGLLPGCKKTPESPIVVGKDQTVMIERAQQTSTTTQNDPPPSVPLKERLACPERVVEELSLLDDLVTIRVDADVRIPDVDKIPVVRTHAANFTQETVTMLFNRLCGGQEMLESLRVKTKSQIEEEIISWRRSLNDPAFADSPEVLENYREIIADLEALYPTAPETITPMPCTGQLEEDIHTSRGVRYRSTYVNGYNEQTHTSFSVSNNIESISSGDGSARSGATMSFSTEAGSKNFAQHPMVPILDENSIPAEANGKLTVTPKEARQLAESILDGTDLVVREMYLTDDENLGGYDDIVSDAETYVYRVYCVRQTAGVRQSFLRGLTTTDVDGDGTAPRWFYENLVMHIGNEGLIDFDWHSPHTISETVVEDAALLSFQEIMEIFSKMLPITLDTVTAKAFYQSVDIRIDRVELEYQRIIEQNSIENGFLVPVWNFYGTRVDTEKSGETSVKYNENYDPRSFLTINAIDGSIINATRGY